MTKIGMSGRVKSCTCDVSSYKERVARTFLGTDLLRYTLAEHRHRSRLVFKIIAGKDKVERAACRGDRRRFL